MTRMDTQSIPSWATARRQPIPTTNNANAYKK